MRVSKFRYWLYVSFGWCAWFDFVVIMVMTGVPSGDHYAFLIDAANLPLVFTYMPGMSKLFGGRMPWRDATMTECRKARR